MQTVRGSAPVDPSKYKHAMFFDNDHAKIENITQYCPTIETQKVPETATKIPFMSLTTSPLKELKDSVGGYANIYVKILQYLSNNEDMFDPISGINIEEQKPIIEEWIDSIEKPEEAIILFDWDRTITLFEGVFLPKKFEDLMTGPITRPLVTGITETQFLEDALRYLLGGDARLAAFRELSEKIGKAGVSIGILTNSGSCGWTIYTNLVNQLFPPEVNNLFIICSRPPPASGHKGKKLRSQPEFSVLCAAPSAAAGGSAPPFVGEPWGGGSRRRSRRRTGRRLRKRTRRGRFNKN